MKKTLSFYSFILLFLLTANAQIKVGVFLPFKTQGAVGYSAVEYYRGLLMAVDSLSQGGQTFSVTAAHSGQSAADMSELLDESKNGVFDIVFGPSNQEQIKVINDYSRRNGTKVVIPFGGAYDDFISNPSFYALRVTQTDFTPEAYQLLVSALKGKTRIHQRRHTHQPLRQLYQQVCEGREAARVAEPGEENSAGSCRRERRGYTYHV